MTVVRSGGEYRVRLHQGDIVCGHRPSVEVLFNSIADNIGANAVGIILTGMGNDGAQGLLNMRDAGAKTLGQDENTSVVYGMPKAAFEKGGVEKQLPIHAIAHNILSMFAEIT